jgi:hypothetical protein
MNHRSIRHDAGGEDGAVLILVLVFMVVFSLIAAASFANAGANFRNTVGVRANEKKVYAADSGINWAISKIRTDNTVCPTTKADGSPKTYTTGSAGGLPTAPQFNSLSPAITCTVTTGSVTGANGWAIITTSPNNPSFYTPPPPPPNFTKLINGPIFASSIDAGIDPVKVTNGAVFESQGRCTNLVTAVDKPTKLTVDPPFSYHCTSSANPADAVDHVLPTSVPLMAPAPIDVASSSLGVPCRIFKPGKYTTTNLLLAKDNYFVSGVYYLENVTLDVRKLQIVGGQSSPDEVATKLPGAPPCGSDADGGGTGSGTGVKLILGGTSNIAVAIPSGRLELFSRLGGAATEGTAGISVQTVCKSSSTVPGVQCAVGQGGAGWIASSLTDTQAVLSQTGNTPRLRIHGQVYTPNALVSFNATNSANAWLLGGVVTGKLALSEQAAVDAVKVSIVPGIGFRTMTVTSKTQVSGERDLVSTVIIQVKNDAARTTTIQSWRTSCEVAGAGCPNV